MLSEGENEENAHGGSDEVVISVADVLKKRRGRSDTREKNENE